MLEELYARARMLWKNLPRATVVLNKPSPASERTIRFQHRVPMLPLTVRLATLNAFFSIIAKASCSSWR